MSELVVLLPVLARPLNAGPVVESIRAATRISYRILFICSPNDEEEIAACKETGAEVLIAPDWPPANGQFSKKINLGYRETQEPWIFQGADDLDFGRAWDTQALAVARRNNASVIGTNDTKNPSVLRGKASTHTLIARSYIEEFGGTMDGSGEVFSELYSHQYADLELVETAMHRGQFASAKNSIVAHRHPHWGNAEDDATYRLGQRDTRADRNLYVRRSRLLWGARPSRMKRR